MASGVNTTSTMNARHRRGWRARAANLASNQRGNTFFMVAAAMVPMIGVVGSGVDVGRAYMAKQRLQQACDSGVLAGRRAMTGGTYSAAHKAEANKMFAFNFQADTYGSNKISFISSQDGPSNVMGTATARLPTALMQVFGQTEFNLSVNCTAKLEISNVDVMFVLDVSGSMGWVNSGDSVNRVQGARNASLNFFDTLTSAAVGDGRLRFGMVYYNHNVNPGALLMAANSNWIADTTTIPSRTPLYENWTYGPGVTTTGPQGAPATPHSVGGYGGNHGTISGRTSANCASATPPAPTTPVKRGGIRSTNQGQSIVGNNRVTTYSDRQEWEFFEYRPRWTSNRCRIQRRTVRYYTYTPRYFTEPRVPAFSRYRYENRTLDVSAAKSGNAVTANTGNNGAAVSAFTDGCIIERQTTAFASNQLAPANAFDMDVDMVPTAADATKWSLQMRQFYHPRSEAGQMWSSSNWTDSNTACPPPAQRLTTMTAADRNIFQGWTSALNAAGNTYHDAGMLWATRLISPTGLFTADNATAPNGRPIQRHIIFMTDGQMFTRLDTFSHQNRERNIVRIGATSDGDSVNRHQNRFNQACTAAKSRNITVWAVAFGTSITPNLTACASPGNAFSAANNAALNTQFQAIAQNISRLRLDQ